MLMHALFIVPFAAPIQAIIYGEEPHNTGVGVKAGSYSQNDQRQQAQTDFQRPVHAMLIAWVTDAIYLMV